MGLVPNVLKRSTWPGNWACLGSLQGFDDGGWVNVYLKDAHQLIQTEDRPPNGEERVWIDLREEADLHSIVDRLHWDEPIEHWLKTTEDRPGLRFHHDVWVLSLAVYQNDSVQTLTLAVAPHIVVSFHRESVAMVEELAGELPHEPEYLNSAFYLLYVILTRVADGFLAKIDLFDDAFDQLEEDILDGKNRAHDVFTLRRDIHRIRGILADMRRISSRLARRQFSSGSTDPSIFVDVYDSFYHIMDNLDTMRDNLTGLVDLQLNQRSTRLNEVMKFLTMVSTVFLPVTFITGFLGMNIHVMPELANRHAQEYTVILMVLVVAAMLLLFKKKGWF